MAGERVTREREGVLLCLVAAAAYSTTGTLSKLAYEAEVGVLTLLVVRTVVAAVLFWGLVRLTRSAVAPRPALVKGFVVGLLGTSVQVWMFASALARIDAALASLLLYAYPAMVAVAAVLIGRERPSARRFVALGAATAGVALVLAGAGGASLDAAGVLLALGAAAVYTMYLLTSHALLEQVPPATLAAVGSSGAAVAFLTVGTVDGGIDLGFEAWGWWPVLGTALCSSVLAVGAGLAGVARVGPTINSIILTTEIPLGVLLAVVFLDERLRPPQIAGAILVLAAVLLLQVRARSPAAPDPRPPPAETGRR